MKKLELYLGAATAALIATPAFAQDDSGPTNVIIVTAQRQAESLQEVPIAVSAFDAEALEAQQIENSSDLQLTLPNITFTKTNFTSSSFYHSRYWRPLRGHVMRCRNWHPHQRYAAARFAPVRNRILRS